MAHHHHTYWQLVWKQFKYHRLGLAALVIIILFCLVGVYAPFLASSKPIAVKYHGEWYFPLFRYMFYTGFFTKRLDIFYNLLIFILPLFLGAFFLLKKWKTIRNIALALILVLQLSLFVYLSYKSPRDPEAERALLRQREIALKKENYPLNWDFDLRYMTSYAKLNLLLRQWERKKQQVRLEPYEEKYKELTHRPFPTLWNLEHIHEEEQIAYLKKAIENKPDSEEAKSAQIRLDYIETRNKWIAEETKHLKYIVMPLIRPFHWEDDAGGDQQLNKLIPWYELTRITRKDLVAALIFGVRVSIMVGILAVGLSLLIGVPIGAVAGFYGGNLDIAVSRLLEIWESMPTFFMLLLFVAITQSKSIFLVIGVIGLFSWPTFSRYIRGEFFKQRSLPYVEACRALGFHNRYIMFTHILPNAIPPVLTLLPFAIMGAITAEAALSFLGLGEEGSCSWGVLMDEGRSSFPGESYLLWPPAMLLTILLVAIALVGDALRDALDPRLRR